MTGQESLRAARPRLLDLFCGAGGVANYTELVGGALMAHLKRPGGESCAACGFDALNCQCGDSAFAGTPLENFRPRVGGIGLGSY